MAASPPSSSAFPPVSSNASPPPTFISPPFSAPGGDSQPNGSSSPPTSSPPPVINATPPSSSNLTPPLSSSSPPSPPPIPSPPASSSPLTPPAPTLSSPPTPTPPLVSEPPQPLILSPPPTLLSPPPVVIVPPPLPSQAQPPPSSTPLGDLSLPPPSSKPLPSIPPSPSLEPSPPSPQSPSSLGSPSPPSPQSPSSLGSPSPPFNSNSSETPPKESTPTPPSQSLPSPSDSSNHNSSVNPHAPPTPLSSFPIPPSNTPGLPSGGAPSFPSNPISPSSGRSSTPSSNDIIGPGNSRAAGGGSKTGVFSPIVVVLTLVAFSFIGILVLLIIKRKKRGQYASGFVMPSPQGSSQFSESSYPRSPTAPLVYHSSGTQGGTPGSKNSQPEPSLGNSKSYFSFEELYHITNGFSEHNLLGEGGFGCVYEGCLPNGREVAVKQLKVGGAQGEREFKAEVEIISRVHHRHLVSLVGYCIAENQRLLVYDYVPNNTLHYHLHGQGKSIMDWVLRVKVAAGAARGIAYLHEDCHPRIIHRDIKSSNILLDNNFEAQVSDFGLARLAMDAYTHVTTRVMGTFGYLAPEYASTGKLTEKSDVFSFGVVLLELISGRKPVDSSQPMGDESLVEWARPLLSNALESGDFGALPDPKLANNYNTKEMLRMMEAAAACVRHSASMRPRMSLVVRALDSLSDIDLSNGLQPGQSELFNTGPQSEEIRMFQRMAFGSQTFFSTEFT